MARALQLAEALALSHIGRGGGPRTDRCPCDATPRNVAAYKHASFNFWRISLFSNGLYTYSAFLNMREKMGEKDVYDMRAKADAGAC